MSTKAAQQPPVKASPPRQPTDESNWHDWLTLGVFALTTLIFLLGVGAIWVVVLRLDGQDAEIKALKASLEQLSNKNSPTIEDSLKQHHTLTMTSFKTLLDQRLNNFQPTPDDRLDQLVGLAAQINNLDAQLKEIRGELSKVQPSAADGSPAITPATELPQVVVPASPSL